MQKKPAKTKAIKCHVCKHETEHKLLCHRSHGGEVVLGGDPYNPDMGWWKVESEVYQCAGCKELVIRRVSDFSEGDYPSEDFYPPRVDKDAPAPPKWVYQLPDGMDSLLVEVYSALQSRSYRLVAMGLRALMDELMTNTLGDIGSFDVKVKRMVADGFLSKVQKDILEPTLELGHAAIHRGHQPSGSQTDAALGIVEGLLNLFYVQSKVVDQLKAGVKPRQLVKAASAPGAAKGGKAKPTAGKKTASKPLAGGPASSPLTTT